MTTQYYMALDVGTKRIGVALAHEIARMPSPLTTLAASEYSIEQIVKLATQEQVKELIVGLPRGMDGGYTDQTRYTEAFAEQLRDATSLPVHLVDETLSSVQAEAEIGNRKHAKAEVDAKAACFILQRFFDEHPELARL